MRYDRSKKIFKDDFAKLQNAKIIILGVGGVGGHALDCLYRSGVNNITIVDYDVYEITNQNRQIGSDALGISKVKHLKTLYPNIDSKEEKIDDNWIKTNNLDQYDLILDAIDDVDTKILIIKKYHKKVISTTGSAKRLDPFKITYKNIWNVTGDRFAKKIRKGLRKSNFKKDFFVICSEELPACNDLGSFVGVTGTFGYMVGAKAIQRLLNEK